MSFTDGTQQLKGQADPSIASTGYGRLFWDDNAKEFKQIDDAGEKTSLAVWSVGKTIMVAKSNGDFSTISSAIAAATALSPSSSNPVAILVYSGLYVEAPFSVPAYVNLSAAGGLGSVVLTTTSPNSAFITLDENTRISGFYVSGANLSGGVGLEKTSSGTNIFISDCLFTDCYDGVTISGGLALLQTCTFLRTSGTVGRHGLTVKNDAQVLASAIRSVGVSGSLIHEGVLLEDGTGNPFLNLKQYVADYCDEGVSCLGNVATNVTGAIISNCDIGLHIASPGDANVVVMAAHITNSLTWDHFIESATCIFRFTGIYDAQKVSYADGADTAVAAFNNDINEPSFSIDTECQIGSHGKPGYLVVGEGGSSVLGMSVLTNTNAEIGTWADITTAAKSAAGSPFTFFPGVSANNCLYIGSNSPFPGIKFDPITVAIDLGSGSIVTEYWDGSAWVAFDVMETDASYPHAQRGNLLFTSMVSIQLRFEDVRSLMALKTLDGNNKYWIRIRIVTGITISPVAERCKIHVNHFEANEDGFTELFGDAEVKRVIDFPQLRDISGFTSGNANRNFSVNNNSRGANNARANGAVDGSGQVFNIPEGLDTSKPLQVRLRWAVNGTATGNVEHEVYLAIGTTGDILNGGLTELSAKVIDTVAVASNQVIQETLFTFRAPSAIPADSASISHLRDATAGNLDDTLAEKIYIIKFELVGTFWR